VRVARGAAAGAAADEPVEDTSASGERESDVAWRIASPLAEETVEAQKDWLSPAELHSGDAEQPAGRLADSPFSMNWSEEWSTLQESRRSEGGALEDVEDGRERAGRAAGGTELASDPSAQLGAGSGDAPQPADAPAADAVSVHPDTAAAVHREMAQELGNPEGGLPHDGFERARSSSGSDSSEDDLAGEMARETFLASQLMQVPCPPTDHQAATRAVFPALAPDAPRPQRATKDHDPLLVLVFTRDMQSYMRTDLTRFDLLAACRASIPEEEEGLDGSPPDGDAAAAALQLRDIRALQARAAPPSPPPSATQSCSSAEICAGGAGLQGITEPALLVRRGAIVLSLDPLNAIVRPRPAPCARLCARSKTQDSDDGGPLWLTKRTRGPLWDGFYRRDYTLSGIKPNA